MNSLAPYLQAYLKGMLESTIPKRYAPSILPRYARQISQLTNSIIISNEFEKVYFMLDGKFFRFYPFLTIPRHSNGVSLSHWLLDALVAMAVGRLEARKSGATLIPDFPTPSGLRSGCATHSAHNWRFRNQTSRNHRIE